MDSEDIDSKIEHFLKAERPYRRRSALHDHTLEIERLHDAGCSLTQICRYLHNTHGIKLSGQRLYDYVIAAAAAGTTKEAALDLGEQLDIKTANFSAALHRLRRLREIRSFVPGAHTPSPKPPASDFVPVAARLRALEPLNSADATRTQLEARFKSVRASMQESAVTPAPAKVSVSAPTPAPLRAAPPPGPPLQDLLSKVPTSTIPHRPLPRALTVEQREQAIADDLAHAEQQRNNSPQNGNQSNA